MYTHKQNLDAEGVELLAREHVTAQHLLALQRLYQALDCPLAVEVLAQRRERRLQVLLRLLGRLIQLLLRYQLLLLV